MHSNLSPLWLGTQLGGARVHSISDADGCLDRPPIQIRRPTAGTESNPRESTDEAEHDAAPGWREARIARLRRAIRAGEYRVDVGRLARRLFRILGT